MQHRPWTSVAERALDLLEGTAEGALEWTSESLASIAQALGRALDEGEGPRAVDDLLRLMSVLQNRRSSPAAADALARLLRSDRRALSIACSCLPDPAGIDAVRGLAEREGSVISMLAPTFGAGRPPDTVPLRSLLDPGRDQRARPCQAGKGALR